MSDQWTQRRMIAVAQEERAELGLSPLDRLDPFALAEHHGIPVYRLDELGDNASSAAAVRYFSTTGQSVWSAALVPVGNARVIIENTSHELVRRISSVAHELGHHLLEHIFDEVLLTEDKKCRQFDAAKEKQARFLSGELLIPQQAARRAAFLGWGNDQVAEHFGVSTQFAQMQMAGARVFAQNTLRRQSRAV